jgi:hypothetical protein
MSTRIDPEYVRDLLRVEGLVQRDVGAEEAAVLVAHIEADERRKGGQPLVEVVVTRDTRLAVGSRRAEVEHAQPRRVRGGEVATPRLDGGERPQVPQTDIEGAVAAGREADQCPSLAGRNRPEAGVDAPREIVHDRPRPVLGWPPIQVLAITVGVASTLRSDDDRLVAAAGHGIGNKPVSMVRHRASREAVQEVDDGVVRGAVAVVGREVYGSREGAPERG